MGAGDINLIAKIAPKNDGFTGMVDWSQVIAGSNTGNFSTTGSIQAGSLSATTGSFTGSIFAGLFVGVAGSYNPVIHAPTHAGGSADPVNHNTLANYSGNQHIDWTGASNNFQTNGSIAGRGITLSGADGDSFLIKTTAKQPTNINSRGTAMSFVAGAGGILSNSGGHIEMIAGAGASAGGNLVYRAGGGTQLGAIGGKIDIIGGDGIGTVSGGNINITVGDGTFGGNDGEINLNGLINANTNKIKNVVDPTNAQEVTTKNYVDNADTLISGLVVDNTFFINQNTGSIANNTGSILINEGIISANTGSIVGNAGSIVSNIGSINNILGYSGTNYWTGSNTNIYKNNTGNVGIGTAAPGEKLEVVGNVQVTDGTLAVDSGSLVWTATLDGSTAGEHRLLRLGNNQASNVANKIRILFRCKDSDEREREAGEILTGLYDVTAGDTQSMMEFQTTVDSVSATRMAIKGADVGIGTTAPLSKLHVAAGTANNVARFISTDDTATIRLSDDDTSTYLTSQDGVTSLGHNSTLNADNLNIDATGQVGIGTATPEDELHVAGDIQCERIGIGKTPAYEVDLAGNINAYVSGAAAVFNVNADLAEGAVFNFQKEAVNKWAFGCGAASEDLGVWNYNSGAQAYLMRMDYIDNAVGFGTTTPQAKVHIIGDVGVGSPSVPADGQSGLIVQGGHGAVGWAAYNGGAGGPISLITGSGGSATTGMYGSGGNFKIETGPGGVGVAAGSGAPGGEITITTGKSSSHYTIMTTLDGVPGPNIALTTGGGGDTGMSVGGKIGGAGGNIVMILGSGGAGHGGTGSRGLVIIDYLPIEDPGVPGALFRVNSGLFVSL